MQTLFIAVGVVLGLSALIAVASWLFMRSGLKTIESPKRLRRTLIFFGILYSFAAIYAISLVVAGSEPPQALIGLPIGLLFVWFYFRAASKVKVPPKD
jgi:hypothetical protein